MKLNRMDSWFCCCLDIFSFISAEAARSKEEDSLLRASRDMALMTCLPLGMNFGGLGLAGRPRATRRSRSRILARLCFLALVTLVRSWMVKGSEARADVMCGCEALHVADSGRDAAAGKVDRPSVHSALRADGAAWVSVLGMARRPRSENTMVESAVGGARGERRLYRGLLSIVGQVDDEIVGKRSALTTISEPTVDHKALQQNTSWINIEITALVAK